MEKEKRRPNESATEKFLSNWLTKQIQNYKTKIKSFKENPERCKQWEDFIEKNKEYIKTYDEKWDEQFEELQTFLEKEKRRPNRITESLLNRWLEVQIQNYKTKIKSFKENPERCKQWEDFIEKNNEYIKTLDELWDDNLEELKLFMNKEKRIPNIKNESEKYLGKWLSHQLSNYKTKTLSFNNNPERCKLWEDFVKEYLTPKKSMKFRILPFVEPSESIEQRRLRVKSELSVLHQKYKTMRSDTLAQHLIDNPTAWQDYHRISEANEESFPSESIPRNQIICELEKIKTKRPKQVVDLGCGKALIAKHFQDKGDIRFQFTNIDHIATDASVQVGDISKLPFENDSVEICILSLAMWGSNCKNYIQEVHRVLETNGILYIIEPTKRWTDLETEPAGRLREWLKDFHIRQETIEKFTLFVAMK